MQGAISGAHSVPGNKVGASIIWAVGAVMTYAALDQISDYSPGGLFMLTIVIQIILTLAQSPVWRGRGTIIGYTCLAIDAIFNFGGTMSFMANLDQMGSVQAMASTFFSWSAELPMPLKGVIALFLSAIIAGLPEYLWKLD